MSQSVSIATLMQKENVKTHQYITVLTLKQYTEGGVGVAHYV